VEGEEREKEGNGRESEGREGTRVIMGMERRQKVESGRNNKGPTITKGERRGKEMRGIKRNEREEKGFARPMSSCFLRACSMS